MGGKGVRFGARVPKQFLDLNNRPLFCYLLEHYEKLNIIDGYIIVTNGDYMEFTREKAREVVGDKLIDVVIGGSTGGESIFNGIVRARESLSDDDLLLLHDATDPILATNEVGQLIEAARIYGFASIYTEQVRVIYQKSEDDFVVDNLEKKSVGSGYSPEAFRFKDAYSLFNLVNSNEYTNIPSVSSLAVSKGYTPKLVLSRVLPLKIIYPEDFSILEKLISAA